MSVDTDNRLNDAMVRGWGVLFNSKVTITYDINWFIGHNRSKMNSDH